MNLLHCIDKLFEASYRDIVAKQSSIYNLFPTFDQRVTQAAHAGGFDLVKQDDANWEFVTNSATDPSKSYTINVKWANFNRDVREKLKDPYYLKKDLSGPNLAKVAKEILFSADMKISCSCPAFQYWGPAYITSKMGSKYGRKENRPPVERNPKEAGAVCKHAQLVLDVLPFYIGRLAKSLRTHRF